jgi:hypothetical protein
LLVETEENLKKMLVEKRKRYAEKTYIKGGGKVAPTRVLALNAWNPPPQPNPGPS